MTPAQLATVTEPPPELTGDDDRLASELSDVLRKRPRAPRIRRTPPVRNAVRVKSIAHDRSLVSDDDAGLDDQSQEATADLAARQSLQWVKRAQRQQQISWLKETGSWVIASAIGSALVATTLLLLTGAPEGFYAWAASFLKA